MPTWFKCKKCGKKYYTATSSDAGKFDDLCEECDGNLAEVYYDVKQYLKKSMMVNFHLRKKEPAKLYSGKVLSVDDREINLIVYSKRSDIILKELSACHVSFARDEFPEGRYFFHGKILSFYEEMNPQIILETPEYIERKQQRQAERYPLKTRVKYRLGDDIKELMEKADSDYKVGQSLDISRSGLLLMDEMSKFEELNPEKYIDLEIEYGDYNISTIGNIARVNRLKEADGKLALGIKFLERDSNNLDIIEELKDKKIVN